jgi:uracil-DNA glycosylase
VPLDIVTLLPAPWRTAMEPHLDPTTVAGLCEFVSAEYERYDVFPPLTDLFAAFRLCSPADTRAVIIGQDPYHAVGQAHGLSFSVRPGVTVPPSLRNVFKELCADLGVAKPTSGDLTGWAEQGVLLLNAVLTVRSGKPGSHAKKGWEHVTDAAIRALDAQPERVVFLLWGAYAQKKKDLLTSTHHVVLEAGHPSPMNPKGFLGSRPFSACNAALVEAGRDAIRW